MVRFAVSQIKMLIDRHLGQPINQRFNHNIHPSIGMHLHDITIQQYCLIIINIKYYTNILEHNIFYLTNINVHFLVNNGIIYKHIAVTNKKAYNDINITYSSSFILLFKCTWIVFKFPHNKIPISFAIALGGL